jgi:hypothetical protein
MLVIRLKKLFGITWTAFVIARTLKKRALMSRMHRPKPKPRNFLAGYTKRPRRILVR